MVAYINICCTVWHWSVVIYKLWNKIIHMYNNRISNTRPHEFNGQMNKYNLFTHITENYIFCLIHWKDHIFLWCLHHKVTKNTTVMIIVKCFTGIINFIITVWVCNSFRSILEVSLWIYNNTHVSGIINTFKNKTFPTFNSACLKLLLACMNNGNKRGI